MKSAIQKMCLALLLKVLNELMYKKLIVSNFSVQ